jgi:hypothetical protein
MSFQRAVQTRTSETYIEEETKLILVKDEYGDLLADCNNNLNGWKNYFYQLRNVHSVCQVRQIQIHTAEPLVTCPSPLELETAIEKRKRYKSPGIN